MPRVRRFIAMALVLALAAGRRPIGAAAATGSHRSSNPGSRALGERQHRLGGRRRSRLGGEHRPRPDRQGLHRLGGRQAAEDRDVLVPGNQRTRLPQAPPMSSSWMDWRTRSAPRQRVPSAPRRRPPSRSPRQLTWLPASMNRRMLAIAARRQLDAAGRRAARGGRLPRVGRARR